MRIAAPALLLALALAACGGGAQDPVENTADQLEQAAEQSDPAAAAVLENAADDVREQNSVAPADEALEKAGNAAAATAARPQRQPAPPSQGAKPHAAGDPVPPPKVPADKGDGR